MTSELNDSDNTKAENYEVSWWGLQMSFFFFYHSCKQRRRCKTIQLFSILTSTHHPIITNIIKGRLFGITRSRIKMWINKRDLGGEK